MSANSAVLVVSLLVAATAMAVGVSALSATRALYRQLAALQADLAAQQARSADVAAAIAAVPHARTASPSEEIRAAVAAALADERERELAEARAFWAAQEAQEAVDAPLLDTRELRDLRDLRDALDARDALSAGSGGGPDHADADDPAEPGEYAEYGEFEVSPYFPRPVDLAGLEPEIPSAATRRHPSDPDFVPSPVIADPEQTVARLASLAEARTPLADIRPGPLGTLDLYIFKDGTTLCLTPGHRETAEQLAAALDRGDAPVLLGGSGVSGAFSLTFTCGDERVFILADRVVASF